MRLETLGQIHATILERSRESERRQPRMGLRTMMLILVALTEVPMIPSTCTDSCLRFSVYLGIVQLAVSDHSSLACAERGDRKPTISPDGSPLASTSSHLASEEAHTAQRHRRSMRHAISRRSVPANGGCLEMSVFVCLCVKSKMQAQPAATHNTRKRCHDTDACFLSMPCKVHPSTARRFLLEHCSRRSKL